MKYTKGKSLKRVDEKNGFICLVLVFTPRAMVIKMSKIAHFLILF